MKFKFKSSFSFILSRSFYLVLGVIAAISIYAAQAAWNTSVSNGTPLTPTLWNDLVAKISQLDTKVNGPVQLTRSATAPFPCNNSNAGYIYFDTQVTGNWGVPCACMYNGAAWRWSPTDNWGVLCD